MGTYQYLLSTGTNSSSDTSYAWRGLLGSTVSSETGNFFLISNSDGTVTEIDGSGLQYTGGALTGGTITGAFRHATSVDTSPIVDKITSISGLNSVTFWSDLTGGTPSSAFDYLLSGNDTILASNIANENFYDGGAGTNTLDLTAYAAHGAAVIITEKYLGNSYEGEVFDSFGSPASLFNNIQDFKGSSAGDFFFFYPSNGTIPTGLTIDGGGGSNTIEIQTTASYGSVDLSSDTLLSIQQLVFTDSGAAPGSSSVIALAANQFGAGMLPVTIKVNGDTNAFNILIIEMGAATSFDASQFNFVNSGTTGYSVDVGTSSSTGVTIVGNSVGGNLTGGSGNDVFTAFANNVVEGGAGFNTVIEGSPGVTLALGTGIMNHVQEFVANSGANAISVANTDTDFVYIYGGAGNDTLSTGSLGGYLFDNNGGTNVLTGGGGINAFVGGGTSHNTMNGGSSINVYYTTTNDTIHGAGTYNTDVLLVGNVNLSLGSSGVQQVILNSGTNSVTFAGSTSSDYMYGAGAGSINTMTLGSGGGYELSTGGTNHMFGGTAGTDVFVGGIGTSDMHGGAGVNLYYVGASDTVAGAGTFNILLELNAGVTETLGGVSKTGIQEVITAGGNNTIDATAMTTGVYLYGNSGNDLIKGGTASDYFYGSTGTNTFAEQAGWGQDTIMDWAAGTNNIIDLTALAAQGVHSLANVTQSIVNGNDTIAANGNSLTLNGYGSLLTASSFHFA